MPLLMGYASHLLGDFFTPQGVALAWPSEQCQSYLLFRSNNLAWGSLAEVAVAWGALLVSAAADVALYHLQLQGTGSGALSRPPAA